MAVAGLKVTFFGDSISTGQGVSIHAGWVCRASRALYELDPTVKTRLCAANGRTTRQALEAMPYEIQSHSPDILVVQFGLNDANHWESDNGLPRVSVESYRANMLEIVKRAKASGAIRVILLGPHRSSKSPDAAEYWRGAASDLFDWAGTALIDMSLLIKPEHLLPDGVHLNTAGHDVYYRAVMPVLAATVLELSNG